MSLRPERKEGPLWVLGTPEVPLVGGSVVLAGREPSRSFLDPGSSPVARTRDQVTIKSQLMMGLFSWAPVVLKPWPPPYQVPFLLRRPLPRPPGRPLVARDRLKPPSASLCIEFPLPEPLQ